MNTGKIVQIIGAVIDVVFPEGHIPPLYNALEVPSEFVESKRLILETEAHMGDN
ncbi:F0F1 ATP synthase subunit beta, partial [Candidatus Gottesmanbacteria bacterium]|nr:F0F1 ATP synthase subunit beta [Candidatus Gottesmanbacteria bacterium]